MALGPGKYDDLVTWVREQTQAQGGVILMVLAGNRGSGFSMQADPIATVMLPQILRDMADSIERDAGSLKDETKNLS